MRVRFRAPSEEAEMAGRFVDPVMHAMTVMVLAIVLQSPVHAAPASSTTTWDGFTRDFVESTFKARPQHAVWAGRHEFDGKLPDWSARGLARDIARLHDMRRRAAAFPDSALSDKQRFERDHVIAIIDR